jgi:hypothetical protein
LSLKSSLLKWTIVSPWLAATAAAEETTGNVRRVNELEVGLYTLHAVDPPLESACFQPLNL